MINIVLRGGCANQIFQFAFGYSAAKRLNTGLIFDVTNYRTDQMRRYSLDLFSGIYRKYEKVVDSLIDIHERGLPYDQELVDQIKYDSCVRGYFQTEKYFEPYAKDLFKIFTPFQPITSHARDTLREIEDCPSQSVFLTIRRTDYVGNTFHGELPLEYYKTALDYIYSQIGEKPYVFVFSDDPDWVTENFNIGYPFTVAGNFDRTTKDHLGREDQELYLMSHCRHAIMANSSYSWWGAYLGDIRYASNRRIVICPKQWFGPASSENPIDIPRPQWVQL